jgi:hypothetical protein|tara:strand:+ start:246 stop:1274 length:1029 start_codon:yes stop_codon:yes gene_type:complete
MVDPAAETDSNLSLQDAASLLMQTPPVEDTSSEPEAPPEEIITDQDQAMPSDEAIDESEEFDPEVADYEEDQTDDDAGESEFEEDVYTVRVNGQDVDVSLDEALKGYTREADYTQKTQQLAEQRKQFEAEQSNLLAERAQTSQLRDAYAQTLQQLEQQVQQGLGQEPDWDRAYQELDAKEYTRLVQDWNARKDNLQKIQVEQHRVQKERATEQQTMMRAHLVQQSELMLQKLPQWQDQEVREAERTQLAEYAKTLGYTDDEIANAADHRAIVALYHSWQLSKLNASKPEAKKRVRKAPKMAKAGVPRSKNEVSTRRRQKLADRHATEGSVASAVDLLLARNK